MRARSKLAKTKAAGSKNRGPGRVAASSGPKISKTAKSKKPAAAHTNGKKVSPGIAVTKPLKFIIPSDRNAGSAAGQKIQKQILDNVTRLGFNTQSQFAIKLALEEALINAMKHGNRYDPAKKVHIEAKISPKQLEVSIEDEGPGFRRHTVPDPTHEDNLEKCSGRGILLMEAYMNSVRWSRGGRRVKMIKKNEEDLLPRR